MRQNENSTSRSRYLSTHASTTQGLYSRLRLQILQESNLRRYLQRVALPWLLERLRNVKTAIIILLCFISGCSGADKATSAPSKNATASVQRFLPTGNDPSIALDTQSGELCRTVSDPGTPDNFYEAGCEIKDEYKDLHFVPDSCRSGKTWTRADLKALAPSKYRSLRPCASLDENQNITHKYDPTTGKIEPVK